MLGKHYLLTGATGSLGRAIIQALEKRGAYVTIIVRDKDKANELIKKYKNIEEVILLNLNNKKEIHNISNLLTRKHNKYDGIINNAGLGLFKSNEDHSLDEIEMIYQINVVHLILLLNNILPYIRKGGDIVNIGSLAGKVTTPYGSHYAASKAALGSYTNSLRMERTDLNIMLVSPGPFKSQFHLRADPTGVINDITKNIQLNVTKLAEDIVQGMIKHKIEINTPIWMDLTLRFYQLTPRLIEKIFKKAFLSKKID